MSDELPAVRTWPPEQPLADDEAIATDCPACGTPWRIHRRLAGFRLRCECAAWIDVREPPASLPPTHEGPAAPPLPAQLSPRRPDRNAVVAEPLDDEAISFRPVPFDAPLRPSYVRNRSPTWQARWIDRTLLEAIALLLALFAPPAAAFLFARGSEFELLLPLASLVSAALVAALAAVSPYGRLGFHRGALRHYAEAVVAAGIGVAFAVAWTRLLGDAPTDPISRLRATLGLLPTLLVVAIAPAVLEEMAFRGMLQGRLLALLGERAGVVTTAIAFAVCHGMPLALPIHFALGLYLGWLRLRAGTLLPGMLMHFVYNGTLVVSGQG